jgi:hypothetical protein
VNTHARLPVDARRTPLAAALQTQRLAFAVIITAGLALNALLAACLLSP